MPKLTKRGRSKVEVNFEIRDNFIQGMWEIWRVEIRGTIAINRKMMSVSRRIMNLKLQAWLIEQEAIVLKSELPPKNKRRG
jgi:hypothetical protein